MQRTEQLELRLIAHAALLPEAHRVAGRIRAARGGGARRRRRRRRRGGGGRRDSALSAVDSPCKSAWARVAAAAAGVTGVWKGMGMSSRSVCWTSAIRKWAELRSSCCWLASSVQAYSVARSACATSLVEETDGGTRVSSQGSRRRGTELPRKVLDARVAAETAGEGEAAPAGVLAVVGSARDGAEGGGRGAASLPRLLWIESTVASREWRMVAGSGGSRPVASAARCRHETRRAPSEGRET